MDTSSEYHCEGCPDSVSVLGAYPLVARTLHLRLHLPLDEADRAVRHGQRELFPRAVQRLYARPHQPEIIHVEDLIGTFNFNIEFHNIE